MYYTSPPRTTDQSTEGSPLDRPSPRMRAASSHESSHIGRSPSAPAERPFPAIVRVQPPARPRGTNSPGRLTSVATAAYPFPGAYPTLMSTLSGCGPLRHTSRLHSASGLRGPPQVPNRAAAPASLPGAAAFLASPRINKSRALNASDDATHHASASTSQCDGQAQFVRVASAHQRGAPERSSPSATTARP